MNRLGYALSMSAFLLLGCFGQARPKKVAAPIPESAWAELEQRAVGRLEARQAPPETGEVGTHRLTIDHLRRNERGELGLTLTLPGQRCYEVALAGETEAVREFEVTGDPWAIKDVFGADGAADFEFCLKKEAPVRILPSAVSKASHHHFAIALRSHPQTEAEAQGEVDRTKQQLNERIADTARARCDACDKERAQCLVGKKPDDAGCRQKHDACMKNLSGRGVDVSVCGTP